MDNMTNEELLAKLIESSGTIELWRGVATITNNKKDWKEYEETKVEFGQEVAILKQEILKRMK